MILLPLIMLAATPPVAPRIPFEITAHGHTRVDYYYWLRNRDDPAVMDYLRRENEWTDSVTSRWSALTDTLAAELRSRIPGVDASVPYYRNGYWYWHEYREGEDYPVHMRRRHPDGKTEVLLDENLYAYGRDYFNVELLSVSPDNSILAMVYDTTGGYDNTLIFKEIYSEKILDEIHDVSPDLAWAADSRMVFYGFRDDTGRTNRIMRRTIGCDDQVCVYREPDSTFWTGIRNSGDMKWVVLTTAGTLESECRILPADTPRDTFRLVFPRVKNIEYYVEPLEDTLFILTNLHGENFSVMKAPTDSPSMSWWRTVLPYDEKVFVEQVDVYDDFLAITARIDGFRKLLIMHRYDGTVVPVTMGNEVSTFYIVSGSDVSSDSVNFWYTSLNIPWSLMTYDVTADSTRILKVTFAGEDFDSGLYRVRRLSVPARDGTEIPVSLVYRGDTFSPGANPLLLYGYGAYGSCTEPIFSSARLSLLNRGFVYAIAHVRGGGEMGRWWYHQGRKLNKKNTFTDFIDCAEYLVGNGYCDRDAVFAMGESAGGLLMGAVVNMRPDLWRGVIAGVPFVDVLTTMLDPTIPLTTSEYEEWGNPAESREVYDYILSYSPVDNLAEVNYPAMYVYTGLNDTQVGYWEPAKWVAGIRYLDTGGENVLLRIEGFGHGGASGRFGWLRREAERYAFLLTTAGIGH